MITYSTFIERFPEFSDRAQPLVERTIAQTQIETNLYEGLAQPDVQQQALLLHTAHNIALELRGEKNEPGPRRAVRSRNESIEFAVDPNTGLSLDSTHYGQRLQSLLYRTPFLVC